MFADCFRNRVNNAAPGAPVFDSCPVTKGEVIKVVAYATALGDRAYEEIDDQVPPDERPWLLQYGADGGTGWRHRRG